VSEEILTESKTTEVLKSLNFLMFLFCLVVFSPEQENKKINSVKHTIFLKKNIFWFYKIIFIR